MRSRKHLWLAAAFILVLAVQLATVWVVVDHARTDEEERALEERVSRRIAAALERGAPAPDQATQLDAVHRQRDEHGRRRDQATQDGRDPLEATAEAVLDRDLRRLEDDPAAADPEAASPDGRDPVERAGKDPAGGGDDPAGPRREPHPGGDQADPGSYATGPDHETRIRPVEGARNSVVITEPGQTFAFELGPGFDDGICLLSNLSAGDYVLVVPEGAVDTILVGGVPLRSAQVDVEEGMTIQSLAPVSILVRPGRVPPAKAPATDG